MRILALLFALLSTSNVLAAPLTAEKAEQLCRRVVSLANAGELERYSLTFARTTEAQQNAWIVSRGGDPLTWGGSRLDGTLTTDFDHDGKPDRLGLLVGQGTCRQFAIVALDRQASSWPPDASHYAGYSAIEVEQDRDLRWATWGMDTYFMYIDDEPVVVTGQLGRERNSLTLLSWLGEGYERPLCAFEPTYELKQSVVASPSAEVCRAVIRNRTTAVPWTALPDEHAAGLRTKRPVGRFYTTGLDLNEDGERDLIALNVFDSSAGCGYDGLSSLDVLTADGSHVSDGDLEKALATVGWGPLPYGKAAEDFYPKLFTYAGKPYVLGPAPVGVAAFSVWKNERVQRCEINQTPQFRIKKMYPLQY